MTTISRPIAVLLAAILLFVVSPVEAQYFGKNKIAYSQFQWMRYESPHFDIFYYPEEEHFLEDVISYAESNYRKISADLDHELRYRIPLIIYKTHEEFRQTNITMAELPQGVDAFAEPVQNRMVMPIDLPPDELYSLIGHELVHIFQYSIFFEGSLGRALRSNAPTWLMEGMASYFADDEDNFDRMVIRDAVVNNFLPPIQAFSTQSYYAYRYGHAAFDFIEQEHGKEGLRNFIYEYRKVLLNNAIGKAVKDSFGYDLEEFNRRFNRYLRKKYFPVLLEKLSPDDYGTQIGLKKRGQSLSTIGPALSPSGELIAAFSTPKPEIDLVILSASDGELIRNLTKGYTNKYEQLEIDSFSGRRSIAWSPVGDNVAVFVKKEGRRRLVVFDALTGKMLHNISMGDIYQAGSPAFSPDGGKVAFQGNLKGVVDLFEYDLKTGDFRNLTRDDFFDSNAWYSADGTSLLYNRRIGEHWKIFSVDRGDPSRKNQITFGRFNDIAPSFSLDGGTLYFSSDRDPNGVYNIYAMDLQTGQLQQLTDVVGGCMAPIELKNDEEEPYLVFNAFFAGGFRLYRMPVRQPEENRIPVPATGEEGDDAEAELFEPPMRLGKDEERKHPFKTHWDIESPSVAIGVANDGTVLSNSYVRFSDLMGDQRVTVSLASVSEFAQSLVQYTNIKRRYNWGAVAFDQRDYLLLADNTNRVITRDQVRRTTGANMFMEYPLSRFYRVEGSVGILDSTQDDLVGTAPSGAPVFFRTSSTHATTRIGLVGDTTRFMQFGPVQGKRFSVSAFYGAHISGETEGDFLQYNLDFRTYKQLTRRSTLAWRVSSMYSAGDRQSYQAFGGINQLRGFEYREFIGSKIAWSNLELRFPLMEGLPFTFGNLGPVRGFLFLDVGATAVNDDLFYDPNYLGNLGTIRIDPLTGDPIKFSFWDSENNRLQDGRASYGFGFQAFILGLQMNWSWARQMDYTQYQVQFDEFGNAIGIDKTRADTGGTRMDFYIVFDF